MLQQQDSLSLSWWRLITWLTIIIYWQFQERISIKHQSESSQDPVEKVVPWPELETVANKLWASNANTRRNFLSLGWTSSGAAAHRLAEGTNWGGHGKHQVGKVPQSAELARHIDTVVEYDVHWRYRCRVPDSYVLVPNNMIIWPFVVAALWLFCWPCTTHFVPGMSTLSDPL